VRVSQERTWERRLFQIVGAAERKPRAPNEMLQRVADRRLAEADRRVLHGVDHWTRLAKYGGLPVCIALCVSANVYLTCSFCIVYSQLLGCAVLGIGIWLQVSKGSYASVIPNISFLGASVLCIVTGVLILIIGFFGCCGAIMENQCMLLTVSVVLVL